MSLFTAFAIVAIASFLIGAALGAWIFKGV